MCNVDLWIRALDLVDKVTATVKWIQVPSHTDILGNERADVLVEEGRVSSPLYHVLSLPDRPVVCLELPSTPPREGPRRSHAHLSFMMSSPPQETPPPYAGISLKSAVTMRWWGFPDDSIFRSQGTHLPAEMNSCHPVLSI